MIARWGWGPFALALLSPSVPEERTRQPVAIAQSGGFLYVANRLSGTVSVIDARARTVAFEQHVGQRLSDVAAVPGRHDLVAIDEAAGQAMVLRHEKRILSIVARAAVPGSPVDVVVASDGSFCSVSSLWGRRVTLMALGDGGLERTHVIDLPFNPRLQVLTTDDRWLIVADSFGGHVAAIDARKGVLTAVRTIEGHTIRGLTLSHDGRRVRFAQMKIESHLPTTREMIAGGYLVGNLVRSVSVDHLTQPGGRIGQWSLESLGRNGNGAGDPGPLTATPSGGMVICLTGVHEVGIRQGRFGGVERLAVGRGPAALAYDPAESIAYVANRFDDSVSVVDVDRVRVVETIALGPKPLPTPVREGERLFHDAGLSVHKWMSCHSCHPDGHTSGILADTLGDGTIRTPKRILSLLGAAETGPWAWNGSKARLDDQIHASLLTTMNHADARATAALAAFIRSLPAPRGVKPETEAARRGRKVFERLECGRCHHPDTFTTDKSYDVGLHDEAGLRAFNPPSLRGVGQRYVLFHDGRAQSIREAITQFRHDDAGSITPAEVDDLSEYLSGL